MIIPQSTRQLTKLSEVCDILSSNFLPLDNEVYEYIGLENIESSSGKLVNFRSTLGNEIKSNKVVFKKGMILYGKLRPYLNKVYVAEFDGIATTEILPMKVKEGVFALYLAYFLKSEKFVEAANNSVSGARMPRVTTKFLQDYDQIPLPPLTTQHAIVARLDDVSATLSNAKSIIQNQINELDALWQSSLNEIFENNIYNKLKVGDISKLQNGYAFKSGDYIISSDTLNFRMSNIRPGGGLDLEHNKKYLPNSYADVYDQFLLNEGDIVIAMTDMATDPKILAIPTTIKVDGRKLLLNQRVGRFFLQKDKISPDYLKYVLLSPIIRNELVKKGGGGVQINLSSKDILDTYIPLPPLPEQQAIVSHLDELHQSISKLKILYQLQLTEHDAMRESILDKAFKGELVA